MGQQRLALKMGRENVAIKAAGRGQRGFTLIELLVTMLISGIVIGAIYNAFNVQRHTYYVQDQVANMQQNLRASLVMMQSDVWMAGYDPDPDGRAACAGIQTAAQGRLELTMDLNGNGLCNDTNEDVTFGISSTADSEPDGVVDGGGVADLGRNVNGGGFQDIAGGIQAIGFAYAFDANHDGQLDASTNGHVIWALNISGTPGADWYNLDTNDDGQITTADDVNGIDVVGVQAKEADIRAVRVWILARAASRDRKFSNATTYVVGRNRVTATDGYRYRLLDTIIDCRNMGL